MKFAKKALAILLSLILVFSFVPTAFASEATEENTEREVYYTDLFFGYSHYLKNATVLTDYHENSYNILRGIYDDFLDSSTYDLSFIKETINKGTSFKDLAKIIGDALGITNFTYEEMLDGANELFVQQMLGGEGADAGYEACSDIANVLKDLQGILNGIEDKYDPDTMTESEFFSSVLDTLIEAKCLDKIPNQAFTEIIEDVHKGISTGATFVNVGSSIIDFSKAFAVAISMENLRIELVYELLQAAPAGSVLYDGMSRLYNQLNQEFHSYFVKNYLVNEVLSEILDTVVSKLVDKVLDDRKGMLGLALGVIKLLNMVVFDVIFDVPDICDLTTQEVLIAYSDELYTALQSIKFDDLTTVFDNAKKFERMFVAYKAAVNAAIDNSSKIALDSNKALLARLKDVYYDTDIYTAIINQAKDTIRNTPEDELIITDYSPKVDLFSTKEAIFTKNGYFLEATDEPLNSCSYDGVCIFTPVNGINADIRIEACRFIVPEGHKVNIDGQVKVFDDMTLTPVAFLIVYGELKVTTLNVYGVPYGDAIFENHGVVRAGGVSVNYSTAQLRQSEDATMYISGNFYMTNAKDTNIKMLGTVVYDGTTRQAISGGIAPTVILQNQVWFRCPVKATRLFNHNGYYYILDSTSNTFVDFDGDGLRDDEDNYPTIPNDCNITINCANPEYCSYISESVQAAKGQTVYISAYPNEGYRVYKWVDSAGKTVSRSDYFELEAVRSETFTVIFTPLVLGDLDGDQIINSVDIAELRKDIMWVESPAPWETKDINGDYWVNVRDLVRLKKMAAGIL